MAETILLTGASGFIAKHIALQLLLAGHAVRGTLRTPGRAEEVRAALRPHLPDPAMADARLSFATADLTADAGWSEAMAGCTAVIHTASPFPLRQPRDEADLIRPAVDGTLRVLRAARQAGVGRVVLTSSAVAVMYGDLPEGRRTYDERDWSQDDHPTQTAYGRSKTHAERAAWSFVQEEAPTIARTTINPVLVAGPALDGHYGTSLRVIERVLSGKDPMQPRFGLPVVDVRDVAAMHVRALEVPASAGKRFLASESFLWLADMARLLADAWPDRGIRDRVAPDFMIRAMGLLDADVKSISSQLGVRLEVSNERARDLLGIDFIPAREAVLASARSILEAKNG